MFEKILSKLKRVTSSGFYISQLDGLRFISIFWVVVVMHLTNYLDKKIYDNNLITSEYGKGIMLEGLHGLSLFFMISGFILSLPFAHMYLQKAKKVNIKYYYFRRLTRLEPPYLFALLIFFAANVWVLGKYNFSELWPHFLASFFYQHNFIYHSHSWVLPVAWSLEVELQFYLVVPLLCMVFLIKNVYLRRGICLAIILSGSIYWFDIWNQAHILKFIHFFFSGILLADLYCNGFRIIKRKPLCAWIGALSLAFCFLVPSLNNLYLYLLKIFVLNILFYTILTNENLKKIFSHPVLITIGSMSYTIYLYHFGIISAVGFLILKFGIASKNLFYLPVYFLVFIIIILLVSVVFYLLIEKPFMKLKLKIRNR
jgi:peptidoglycan/LPS O-acetylase OafA/YrhL